MRCRARGAVFLAALAALACSGDNQGSGPPANPDRTPPTVAIVAPDPGPVTGIVVLTADASDAGGMAAVEWKVNGGILGASDSTPPYQHSWNTAAYGPGIFSWTAVARDRAGNATESEGVTYTVSP